METANMWRAAKAVASDCLGKRLRCGSRSLSTTWTTARSTSQFYQRLQLLDDWFSSPKKATTGIWPGTCGFNRETCWVPGFPLLGQAAKWPKGSEKIARIWSGGFVTVDVGVTRKFLLNILVVSRRL